MRSRLGSESDHRMTSKGGVLVKALCQGTTELLALGVMFSPAKSAARIAHVMCNTWAAHLQRVVFFFFCPKD